MPELLRQALVIARRDFTATVFSRAFLLFIVGPLFPILFGALFAAIGVRAEERDRETVAIVAPAEVARELRAAKVRLDPNLPRGWFPDLRFETPRGDPMLQTAALLGDPDRRVRAVLGFGAGPPLLVGERDDVERLARQVRLLLDERAQVRAGAPPPALRLHPTRASAGNAAAKRGGAARVGQVVIFVLTLLLAGMLLSNLIEEKASKVIEVLAAAVPVDAIFLGKLLAMLAMSLVGVAVWGAIAGTALGVFAPELLASAAPAIGWPAFLLLLLVYYTANYLLLGAIFLSIGGHAATVREVQTISMPVTMLQLVLFAFASAAVGSPDSPTAYAAAVFPWSSPLAMIARAAETPALWPHFLAIAWQAGWIALTIRVAARRFRRGVLGAGSRGGGRFSWLPGARGRAAARARS